MLVEVRRQVVSIEALDLSFFRGATVCHMSRICAAMLVLQIWRRILRSAPHHSAGVSGCLAVSGSGAGA